MQADDDEIFKLAEAAKFARVSRNMMSSMIRDGYVRAIRMGKGLRIIKADLLSDLRALAGKEKTIDKITGKREWQSTSVRAEKSGTYVSSLKTEKEYRSALGHKTSKQRSGSTIK